VGTAAVVGLAGLRYEDNAEGGAAHTELAEEARARVRVRVRVRGSPHPINPDPHQVRVRGEVDRVYLDAPDLLQLRRDIGEI